MISMLQEMVMDWRISQNKDKITVLSNLFSLLVVSEDQLAERLMMCTSKKVH